MYETDIKNISNWIRKKVGKTKNIIIGVSGGIDSAVVLALSIKAVGTDRVIPVILPCNLNQSDESDAELLIRKYLNLKSHKISLHKTYLSIVDALQLTSPSKFTLGNIQSRLRMVSLYAFANEYNGYVMGTTNKSEMMIGYFTKYGDGGVDFEPIADYYKTEIWEMAKELDIPQVIIDKQPSAGLWDGQTDENELNITYKELDMYLQGHEEVSNTPTDDISIVDWINKVGVINRILSTEHKRTIPNSYKR